MKSLSVEEPNLLQELRNSPSSRRSFLKTMGAAGLGVAAVMMLDGCGGGSDNNGGGGSLPSELRRLPGNTNDQKILNFALTLEFLEADLYRQALNLASGKPLNTQLGNRNDYTLAIGGGGLDTFNTQAGFAYIRDFAFVEDAHAKFLRDVALSGAPKVTQGTYKFSAPVAANIRAILTAILPLEETGVRAYLGAGQYLSDLRTLQTAVSIYSTEARHSSAINYILGLDPGPYNLPGDKLLYPVNGTSVSTNTFEHFLEPGAVIRAITPYIA